MTTMIYQGEWFKDYFMNAFKFEWSDLLILEKVEQMDEHFGLLSNSNYPQLVQLCAFYKSLYHICS